MKKRVYTVATSHLDTIWSWDFETTVSHYIYDTIVDNVELFKKYPSYTFNFEGSYRYELMQEYYPEEFELVKKYVKEGRWNVCGSAFENGDVNCPSPEALFRNILIGNTYFDETFGKRSVDIYLPDCFGFGWALPSIAHHANLKGFTTQKLTWGSAYGTPFDIGKWYGVDGNYIYASVNPHDYVYTFTKIRDLDLVQNKLKENEKYGLDWTYIFHGIGDRGGAPKENSVICLEKEMANNDSSDIEILSAPADQIYHDIDNRLPQEVKDKLPEWKTELVMQNHGVGGYTSRAIGKRWNSKCQELGDIAERIGVMAKYLGAAEYNEPALEIAWKRAIAHQFHDDTPGTSVQRAYKRSWNDYAMSINQFKNEIAGSLAALSGNMDTSFCKGKPIMVYNSLETARASVVEVELDDISTDYVRVYDNQGKETLCQAEKHGSKTTVLFTADMAPLSLKVYDIRPEKKPCKKKSALTIGNNIMSNDKYEVRINTNGDIASIIDKSMDKELLKSPIVLGQFNYTGSHHWPAWEMNYKQANKKPDRIPQVQSIKIKENGPVRVTYEVTQIDGKSTFKKYISLESGGKTVNVYNEIEWESLRTMCKNIFSLTAENPNATYDLGLGAIKRGNMNEKLFEVPAQKWADITDNSKEYGVSVISECKHGWDKYDDNTLRLTAIHTPKTNYRIDSMHSMMDLGLNLYSYYIFSHSGEVGKETQIAAKEMAQPLVACKIEKHTGVLGSEYIFGTASDDSVIMRALKAPHHKDSDEVVVRLNEGANKAVEKYTLTLGNGIESARELYASEEYLGEATVEDGKLITSFKPYQIRTFALKLKASDTNCTPVQQRSLHPDYNITNTHIPDRLIKDSIIAGGTKYAITNKLMACDGQTIAVNKGERLALLCASLNGDKDATFVVNGKTIQKRVNDIYERYAGWDLYDLKETAYIKDGNLGYEFTHSVDDEGYTQFAKGMYFWTIMLDGTTQLPKDKDIVILSATATTQPTCQLLTQLEDSVEQRPFTYKMNLKEKLWYIQGKMIWHMGDKDNYFSHRKNGKNGKRIEQTKNRLHNTPTGVKG